MYQSNIAEQWFAIVNPISGNGKCSKQWNAVSTALNAANIDFQYQFTSQAGEAKILVQQALEKGYRKILCVGGDGNLHDVVNGLLTQSLVTSNEVLLAIIPLGTGNDFVRHYGISTNIKKAVAILKTGKIAKRDAGLATSYIAGKKHQEFFVNFCGVGFDAFVVERAAPMKPYGQLAYLLATLRWIFSYQKPTLKIMANGKTILTPCYLALAGIGEFSGGGMRLTPNADAADGLFQLTFAKNLSLWEIIPQIKMLYDGSIYHHPKVERILTDAVAIEVIESSNEVKMQADGDMLGCAPFQISILPQALTFLVP